MYFKVTKDSETGKKFADVYNRAQEAWEKRSNLIKELMKDWPGMTGQFREPGGFVVWGGIYSLLFSEKPDPEVWLEVMDGEFMPLEVSEKGTEISKKISDLPLVKYTDINKCLNHYDAHNIIGFIVGTDYFGFEIDPKWEIEIPADAEEILASEYEKL